MTAKAEHEYLIDHVRKMNAVIGDGANVLARVRRTCILWPSDLWALRMLSRLVKARTIVEIGSHKGGSMLWLAWCFRPKQITCVDPMLGMSGPRPEVLKGFAKNAEVAEQLGVNVTLIQGRHQDVANQVPGDADLLFVDGYHSEEFVTTDLELGWPKVRPGGVLCGHDYCDKHPDHLGVVRAVNKWKHEPEVTLLLPSRIFFVRKP